MTTAQTRQEWLQLGQRIKDARRARNLTQQDVADALGLTRTTMTQVERGKQNPLLHLPELSALFTVPMVELLDAPEMNASGLAKRLLTEDEDRFLRAYRRRDLAELHRLIEAWYNRE